MRFPRLAEISWVHLASADATPVSAGNAQSISPRKQGVIYICHHHQSSWSGCSFFAYSWKLPAYSGAFLNLQLTILASFTCNWSVFTYNFSSFFTCNWNLFAYNGRVRLISALRDCKQRSLTVCKKAPTLSRKLPPILMGLWGTRS